MAKMTAPVTPDKMTHAEFILAAIAKLRKPPYKGIHSVYSGFNAAFREYFPGDDPIKVTTGLDKQGVIACHMARGGAMLYMPADKPAAVDNRGAKALSAILG